MDVTFLVKINLDPGLEAQLADIAGDIQDDLESAGHDVTSVQPWARGDTPAINLNPTLPPPLI